MNITSRLLALGHLALLLSCNVADADSTESVRASPVSLASEPPAATQHRTTVHAPPRLESIELGSVPGQNRRVRCETCHALRTDAVLPTSTEQLVDFHQGMSFRHGELSCGSCHAAGQPPQLKLADGRTLATSDALQLCAQCHGPQYRDYRHGAHGGMTGHWDLRRGPRLKNHCVDCHDPHTPAMVPVAPVLPPRDRFFVPQETH